LSDSLPIRSCLKQGDALSPQLFNFASEYAIWKLQENQAGLKLNGTHQLLAFADDVNLLGDDIHTAKSAGQNRDVKISNRSFGNVSQFRYLGTTVTNQNFI
jgi:hypothetical protein